MARGEQRGNREAKKPKKDKPKPAPATSSFATSAGKAANAPPAGKKK
jgi:hypothetical protein